ncbi:Translation initiation factor IF-3 [Tolypocladium ophioglossoides CBS 100239]|uniref:Translation initiation factor IF-3 n=1 Tax=Tolypocladium ophioglossoides (strain CBS 100239) TaxID=1163406 RepID=A0A0L0MY54_TOLOC|nr:Translation initiation factor IF-3 [Tolypocladium ophioglossoides CBS 100239]
MRATPQCLYSARRALYRVFISPAELPRKAPVSGQHPPRLLSSAWAGPQLRLYGKPSRPPPRSGGRGPGDAATRDPDARGFDRRFTTQKDIERSGRDRPPQDHEITDPQIMVIDNGASEGPLATSFVLTKLEPEESLRMIQPYVPADAKNGRPSAQLAVCKIVNKRDEYARQRQLKEKRRAGDGGGKPKTKELELTWAIGEHDLATKMRQMGGFLAKGMKVELMLGRKKGGKQVSGEEAADVVRRVREEVAVHGGREGKPASGHVGATMRMFLEGKGSK